VDASKPQPVPKRYIGLHVERHFLKLQGKAEREELSEEERQAWMHIVDCTDYQRLCADRARPFYAEGVVRKRNAAAEVFVEWEDGETEWLTGSVPGTLQCLKDGDVFSAFVKRDHRDKTVRVESVSFLGERETVYAELPPDWPPALQVAEGTRRETVC